MSLWVSIRLIIGYGWRSLATATRLTGWLAFTCCPKWHLLQLQEAFYTAGDSKLSLLLSPLSYIGACHCSISARTSIHSLIDWWMAMDVHNWASSRVFSQAFSKFPSTLPVNRHHLFVYFWEETLFVWYEFSAVQFPWICHICRLNCLSDGVPNRRHLDGQQETSRATDPGWLWSWQFSILSLNRYSHTNCFTIFICVSFANALNNNTFSNNKMSHLVN